MQWQNWLALGSIALFIAGFVLMGWLIRWTDRRHWRAAQMEASALQAYGRLFADTTELNRAAGAVRPAELIPRGLSDIIFLDAPMADRDPGAF